MHILKHVNATHGNVNVAVDLACAQAAAGHSVVVCSAGGDYEELLKSCGVALATLPNAAGVSSFLSCASALRRHVMTHGPQILHAHMMSSAMLASAIGRWQKIPLVTTVHNSFDGHSFIMRLGDKVVAVSAAERRLLISRGYPSSKVVSVRNAVGGSPRGSINRDQGPSFATRTITTVSGLHRRKAVHDVVSAFSLVSRECPEWHLKIVGDGPDRNTLESMVSDLRLDEKVTFLGHRQDIAELLQETSIFVHAATEEPFGLVVAEARLAGCAIIASNVGGIPEILEEGRAGYLVPPSDPQALASALLLMATDSRVRMEWRERATVSDYYSFSVSRMCDEYLEVYRCLV